MNGRRRILPPSYENTVHRFSLDFATVIDIIELFADCDLDYLQVDETRFIVLFHGEVIRLQITTDARTDTTTIHGYGLETSRSRTNNWRELLDRFTSQLRTVSKR